MGQSSRISFAERWNKRRLFIKTLICITFVIALDLLTILSFDSFPREIVDATESHEIYLVLEEWYLYVGYLFSVCFYILLLGVMSVILLANAWNNRFLSIPALLIWCASLRVISSMGFVGKLLSASHPNIFSQIAEGLGQLSLLPLMLCVVYYMRQYRKPFVPFVLAECFCSSALLFSLVWRANDAWVYVTDVMSDGFFVLCFCAFAILGLFEQIKGNDHFRFFLSSIVSSFVFMFVFRGFVALAKNGFVISRVRTYLSDLSFSIDYIRESWLEGIFLLSVAILLVSNCVRRYHNHTLQIQGLRLRNEANFEYARSIQRYETSVRKIKHDIGNTLNVALVLCKNGEYDQLQEYLETLSHQTQNVRTGNYCEHILTNYILLMFEDRFLQCGATFKCKALLPANICITDTDIAGVLNNILQNALEAVKNMPRNERWVELTVCLENRVVKIDCTNPYRDEPELNNDGLLLSSKTDRIQHGYGLRIISDIVEKYGGVVVPSYGEGVFEVRAALPNGYPLPDKSH